VWLVEQMHKALGMEWRKRANRRRLRHGWYSRDSQHKRASPSQFKSVPRG
jgi:hypothetical protein